MDGQDVEDDDIQLAETEEQPGSSGGMTLFSSDDPEAVMEEAEKLSKPLADMIESRGLFSDVLGNKHVNIEGWTLLGSMVGVQPVTEWTNPVELAGAEGFEAKVNAVTRSGEVIGSAEAMCMNDEDRWEDSTLQELRSMAQTRAASKALRMSLGFIVELGGFSATPAEEMTSVEDRESSGSSSSNSGGSSSGGSSGGKDPGDYIYPFGDDEGKPLSQVETESLEWLEGEYLTGDKLEGDFGDKNQELKEACQAVISQRQKEQSTPDDDGVRSELKAEISAYANNLDWSPMDEEWSIYVRNTADALSDGDEDSIEALESIRDYLKDCDEGTDLLRLEDDDTLPVKQ